MVGSLELPPLSAQVRETETCAPKSPAHLDFEVQKWAHKPWKSTASTVKRRLMSAPPVMKHWKDTEQERNVAQEVGSEPSPPVPIVQLTCSEHVS